ncbi:MAG: hypothetical protein EB051_03720 [Chlamydiia bacterium]|nr:hypothetical protein [Chlamydiia bacterium]
MQQQLPDLSRDVDKGFLQNKTALQRVGVSSILFEKTFKVFRKESLAIQEKEGSAPLKASIKKTQIKKISKKF